MSLSVEFRTKPVIVEKKSNRLPDSDTLWKKELANATTCASTLLKKLNLLQHLPLVDDETEFNCLVTDSYLKKIQPGKLDDPLLKQVLPLHLESDQKRQQHGMLNPVGDLEAVAEPGLIHKYHGRALLISTGACAIHCRYCFRRHYPYQQSSCTNSVLTNTLSYLNNHPEIDEIILSGGDPLVLDNNKLSRLITQLETVSHLRTLRIHSRLPVVLPERINRGLVELLQTSRFNIVLVIHANHANELADAEYSKLHLLHQAGITLLNQTVLLKGVNDDAASLVNLSKRLFECKTLPYYLHLLDPVKGAMHFDTEQTLATQLIQNIEKQLPGYLVPRLVREIAGKKSKTAFFRN